MAIEIKQHLKLQQQLVMTPQLQQAIKLLQLSRMELADTIRDEMLENPILEDAVDTASEEPKTAEAAEGERPDVEHVGETETPVVEIREDKIDTTAEVKADSNSNDAVNDFDWEGYLDNQAAAAPMPSYKSNNEDLPSLESTLTRGTSLFDHLAWQLKLSPFSPRAGRDRDADHRQPDPGRLPQGPARRSWPRRRASAWRSPSRC